MKSSYMRTHGPFKTSRRVRHTSSVDNVRPTRFTRDWMCRLGRVARFVLLLLLSIFFTISFRYLYTYFYRHVPTMADAKKKSYARALPASDQFERLFLRRTGRPATHRADQKQWTDNVTIAIRRRATKSTEHTTLVSG